MTEFFASFDAVGKPEPQGSKTGFVRGGRAVIVDKNPAALKSWRAEVARAAEAAWCYGAPVDGPVRVRAVFVLPRGASVKRELPSVRPDLDKLARALLDGITDAGCVWGDDAQVVRLDVSKVYGDAPGAHVRVSRCRALEAALID
ncbi:hypothetical protein QYM36_019435 [Artemia franciscana]|uniref:Uncharacterized protein n=1 Tax=Artemia franciscana TaxID=6661 RepID=A0AA88H7W6_ARTSF|nr:hypothetical protein QYM36_019435 [Artemia franciscana]